MQVIKTKFVSPTNYKPARVSASCEAGRIMHSWDYSEGVEGNHKLACEALLKRLQWNQPHYPPMVGGQAQDGAFYWVFAGGNSPIAYGEIQSK